MNINKYSNYRDVYIQDNGVIFQPTYSNKTCERCRNGIKGNYSIRCKKHRCICGKNYHCKYFKRRLENSMKQEY